MSKEKLGRPLIIATPEEFEAKVTEYVAACQTGEKPMTFAGMALFLGFADRQSFYDYEKRDAFSCVCKKARLMVEDAYEQRLSGNACAGAIFALKNHGWSDKQAVEHTGPEGGPIQVTRRIVSVDAP